MTYLTCIGTHNPLTPLQAGSCIYRIAFGLGLPEGTRKPVRTGRFIYFSPVVILSATASATSIPSTAAEKIPPA